jgi:hypothetical protein
MSLLHDQTVICAACAAEQEVEFADSVNADSRPDLRDAILDGSFQAVRCAGCGVHARLPPNLTYLDAGRKQWFLVLPAGDRPFWDSFETGALDIFTKSFGAGTPQRLRALGESLSVRVVFGWSGLREKLLCAELGIADADLELLKVLLMRSIAAAGLTDTTSLRLTGQDAAGMLRMAWIDDEHESERELLSVPRELIGEIAHDAEAWAALRAEITGGPFVDVCRMLVEPELPVAE